MNTFRTLKALAFGAVVVALTACGGGSDADKAVPTGGALANVWFADSDSYFPLDKLKPNGSFYTGSEADFGPVNPAYSQGNKTNSRWAIDISASVDAGSSLQYSMVISGVNASNSAVTALQNNLRLDANTGLITQTCSGFPNCYENTTGVEEDFLITVTAKVVGGKGSLQRNFLLRVR
jgi:hypothetical protein